MDKNIPAPENTAVENKKNNKIRIAAIALGAAALIAIILGIIFGGSKKVTVTISKLSFNETMEFETDKKDLGSLLNSKGLLNIKEVDGKETVIGIRGINIDPQKGEYWEIYANGEKIDGSLSDIKIKDKTSYEFIAQTK